MESDAEIRARKAPQRSPSVLKTSGSLLVWSLLLSGGVSNASAYDGSGELSCPPVAPFVVPLPIPSVLAPTSSDATTDYFYVTMQVGQKEIIPGKLTTIWGYNGMFPGPTIIAKRNRRAVVHQTNNLQESMSVHLHGGHTPSASDGHPTDLIGPGASKTYVYPNKAPGSTLWYHDHAIDVTGRHIYMGLAAFYLLTDRFDKSLRLPKGANDVPLLLQDRTFNSDGSFNYPLTDSTISTGVIGDRLLVNGAIQPYFQVSRRKMRFRILNGSNARIYELALSSGDPLVQIASDGGLLAAPVTRQSISVAPAERIEVVIDFAKYPVGTSVILKNQDASAFPAIPDVMRFDIVGDAIEDSAIPARLRPMASIRESSATVKRNFTLELGSTNGRITWTINQLPYDPARIDATPRLNATEIWTFENRSGESHPIHIHDIEWQILDLNGTRPPPGDDGWKDTFLVPAWGRLRVIGTFTDNVGPYVTHCHKLEHEDHAMMFNFEVKTGPNPRVDTSPFLVPLGGHVQPSQAAAEPPASNRRMTERLAEIGQAYDQRVIAQRPDPHLARYLRHVDAAVDERTGAFLAAKSAHASLLAGDSRAAAEGFQKVKDAVLAHPAEFDANFLPVIRGYLAISYLRLGEQANCCSMYGPQSCLLPIAGDGVHQDQEGSRAAIREYLELLEKNPGDMTARWLLNVAYMTIGEHPEKVPPRWLIPAEKFAPTGAFPRFTNVAPSLDLGAPALAGGCVMDDFNGDGFPDLLVSSSGLDPERDQLRYFENKGDGTFEDRTEAAGLKGLVGGMNLLQADYDNDGHLDVLVLRGAGLLGDLGNQPPSLLRNRGDGTFEDVTEKAGLLFFAPTQCGAWGDFDNDGFVDLFVGIESSAIPGFDVPLYQDLPGQTARPCKLFRNNGDGTFTDVAVEAGVNVSGYVRGAAWGDLDNDGFPELAVAQAYGPALLFHNRASQEGKLTRVFAPPRTLEPAHSSSVTFLDYDQDGWLDLFVTGYSKIASNYAAGQVAADLLGQPHTAELSRLYHNDGALQKRGGAGMALSLRDVTVEAKLDRVFFATGAVTGDLDNDGWPDLYLSTGAADYRAIVPKRLLHNLDGGCFEDVSYHSGVAHLQKGSEVAIGDVNQDGQLDIFQVLGGEFPGDVFPRALFTNPGNENHWLELQLVGTHTNRSALGARIVVNVQTPRGPRTLHAVVSSGGSYGGSPLTQHIGLGDASQIESVEIVWPRSQTVQRFTDVTSDHCYRAVEGAPELTQLK